MNKAQLIDQIAIDTNLSKADASRMIESFVTSISCTLKKGWPCDVVGIRHVHDVSAQGKERSKSTNRCAHQNRLSPSREVRAWGRTEESRG